jgi:integrase
MRDCRRCQHLSEHPSISGSTRPWFRGFALSAACGEYEGLVLTLSYCGLRWGEVVGLRVRDLDMLRRRATISENAVQSGKQIHVGTPKAHKQRTVPAGTEWARDREQT